MPTIQDRFRCRRGTAAALAAANEVPLDSEIVLESDTGLGKIGDGVKHYNDLLYRIVGNVDLSGLQDGYVLTWDATAKQWKAGRAAGGAVDLRAGTGIQIDVSTPSSPLISALPMGIGLSGRVLNYGSLPTGLTASDAGKAYLVDSAPRRVYVWDGTAFPLDTYGVEVGNGKTIGLPHKWWRILITSNNGGSNINIAEFQAASDAGGGNILAGGAGYASSVYSGAYPVAAMFDGNLHTVWASSNPAPYPSWVAYKLSAPAPVNEVRLAAGDSPTQGYAPKDFVVQSSDDSTTGGDGTWTNEWTVTGATGWPNATLRSFTRP